MHILVFPGWYPGRTDKLSGDFIQRHLHAISQNCKVSVIIPVKDSNIKKTEKVKIINENIDELYYYYPSISSVEWLDNLLSFIRYNFICLRAAKSIFKNEKVVLVHLYVLQKNHLIGLLLKRLYNIPYVISEQSTIYVDGRWEKLNWFQRKMVRYVFLKAASFHAVSKFLLFSITTKLPIKKQGVVIPNVVDTKQFYYKNHLSKQVTFVHVSNMSYQKNVEGMLQAFAEVKRVNSNFLLHLVGPIKESIRTLIKDAGLDKCVVIWNERNYTEVAEIMQQSDAFVFFTRFETFGCVIIEANACGLPVILSDLEVTRELITDKLNGLFTKTENVKDLAVKIVYFIKHQGTFNPLAISLQTRNNYNYERISLQFLNWYNDVCKSVSKNN